MERTGQPLFLAANATVDGVPPLDALFGPGAVVALVLIVLLALLLPHGQRKRTGGPALALGLYFLMWALHATLPRDQLVELPFEFLAILSLLLSIGRSVFLLTFCSILTHWFGRAFPKIVLDVIQGLIFAAALLITLRSAGVTLTSLVTGSALVTAAISLSMRDTLGNLFAGLAIQIQHPFEVGDWIQFDEYAHHVGEVLEINWRATKVITLDKVEVVVPNAELAQAPIRNFTKPRRFSRRSIYVVAPYEVPTRRVHQVILDSVKGSWGVLDDPPPSVVTNDFNERGVEYWVRIFTDRFDKRDVVDSGVRDRIWYGFHRQGITIPGPLRHVQMEHIDRRAVEELEVSRFEERKQVLQGVDFLQVLPEDAIEQLAAAARRRLYAEGEVIVRQGDAGSELFILTRGRAAVSVTKDDGSVVEIGRLAPPKFFGEMAFMTGEPRAATVTVLNDCETYVIDKDAFAPILEAAPKLVEHVSEVLAARRAETDHRAAEHTGNGQESFTDRHSYLLNRIRDFFSLGGVK